VNVDSVLLAKFAEVSHGSLTVVGTFNRIDARELPARLPSLAVSVVVHAHHDEAGSKHQVRLELLNGRREMLGKPLLTEFRFMDRPVAGIPLLWIGTFTILAPEFPEHGPYAFEIYIDDTYSGAATLLVAPA
jgi:hypothetical protein